MPQTAQLHDVATMSKTVQTGRSPKTRSYMVKVEWLEDGQCFMATSDDIDGLVLEGDDTSQLEQYLREVIPMLLEDDFGHAIDGAVLNLSRVGKGEKKFSYRVSQPV